MEYTMNVQKIAAHALLSAALLSSTISHSMSPKEKMIAAGCLVATGIVIGAGITLVAMGITFERISRNNIMVDKSKLRQLKIDAHGCRKLKQSFEANGYDELKHTYIVMGTNGTRVYSKGVLVESWVELASKVLADWPIDTVRRQISE
jgi:hypothetical protein